MVFELGGTLSDEGKAVLARVFGLSLPLRVDDSLWIEVLRRGVIVSLHVRRSRARVKLDPERDLGLPTGDAKQVGIQAGHRLLLPARFLAEAESKERAARTRIARYTYQTPYGQFLPEPGFAELMADLGRYEQEYMAIPTRIGAEWRQVLDEVTGMLEGHAEAAYARLSALGQQDLPELNEFVLRYVQRAMADMPSREAVMASFLFRVEVFPHPLPLMLTRPAGGEGAMSQAVRELAERRRERILEDMADLVAQLRAVVWLPASRALRSIEEHGRLIGRTSVQLTNLASVYRRMAIVPDTEVETLLQQIDGEMEKRAGDRDLPMLCDVLGDLVELCETSLEQLGRPVAE